ncbi:MAG: hypothetical protein MZV64_59675 [Ignavibacteriales bacterium]|nr:hypothetical protein [Ignavibacteriales bacterium]
MVPRPKRRRSRLDRAWLGRRGTSPPRRILRPGFLRHRGSRIQTPLHRESRLAESDLPDRLSFPELAGWI